MKSWPIFSSSIIASMVLRTQATDASSRLNGFAVRSTMSPPRGRREWYAALSSSGAACATVPTRFPHDQIEAADPDAGRHVVVAVGVQQDPDARADGVADRRD